MNYVPIMEVITTFKLLTCYGVVRVAIMRWKIRCLVKMLCREEINHRKRINYTNNTQRQNISGLMCVV